MIKIKINTGNAALCHDDSHDYEVSRILRELADCIENQRYAKSVNDCNGNPVCTVEYTGKDRC